MTQTDAFRKPDTPEELVLLRRAAPSAEELIPCPGGQYPEAFFRVRLRFAHADDAVCNDPDLVAESSPLFWEQGTPAQVLLCGQMEAGTAWTLSLTRWGVLRWEWREAGADGPAAAVEARFALNALLDPARTFYAGVTLAAGRRGRVRLVLGEADGRPSVVGELTVEELPTFRPLPDRLRAGAGPEGRRPVRAEVEELLVANTATFDIFDHGDVPLDAAFPGGSGLSTGWADAETLGVRPGAEFGSASGNYWHFFRITDPRVRRVRFERAGGMSACSFCSRDRVTWHGLRQRVAGDGPYGERRIEAFLPEWSGPLYVANCPVFGIEERERTMARARELGAEVQVLGRSRAGLPMVLITQTDRSVPLDGKLGVVMVCGQHSPVEQMTGWIGASLMEELARMDGSGEHAGLLRRLAFLYVPIFNIDCAYFGTNGGTLDGANPNRRWFEEQGPEQRCVEDHLLALRDQGLRPALMIDCHAGAWRNHNLLTDYEVPQEQADDPSALRWPDTLKAGWLALLDRVAGLREVWRDGHIGGRAPEWFQATFGAPALTIECSTISHLDPATRTTRAFTHESLLELGRNLARALAEGQPLLRRGTEGGATDEDNGL